MIDIHATTVMRSALWDKGFRPVPVYNPDANVASAGKRPRGNAWQEAARENPPVAAKARPDSDALNTGILADGLRAIDIDVDTQGVAAKVRDLAVSTLGAAPERFRNNSERVLLLYRAASGSPHKRILNGANGDKIEVLGHGNQFVAYGNHASGEQLSWYGGFPGFEVGVDDLTPVTEDEITAFLAGAARLIGAPPLPAAAPTSTSHASKAAQYNDIKAALNVITTLADSYDSWIRIGLAIHAETGGSVEGFELWNDWSRSSAKHDPKVAAKKWRGFSPRDIAIGSLFQAAQEAMPGWRAPSWDDDVDQDDDATEDAVEETRTPSLAILSNRKFRAPPLPLSAFGPFWSGWISDASQASSAPPDYTAIPLLTVAAGLIGNSRKVQVWYNWQEPCVLWAATVGEPSAGKTPGAAPVMSGMLPLVEVHMARDYPAQRDEWTAKEIVSSALHDAWKKEVAQAACNGDPIPPMPDGINIPPKPVEPCARIGNVTMEKLVSIVSSLPKGVLSCHDELAGWLLNLNRYSGAGTDRPFWLESYMGGSYRVDRQKLDEPIRIPHLSVSIFGTIQPEKLAEALKGADDGLASRFLWSWPESQPFQRPERGADIEAGASALKRLADLTLSEHENGALNPVVLPLTADASDVLYKYIGTLGRGSGLPVVSSKLRKSAWRPFSSVVVPSSFFR